LGRLPNNEPQVPNEYETNSSTDALSRFSHAIREVGSPIATLGLTEIVEHYEAIIRELDSPPIIITGHFLAD
jgi:hypothetical protein